MAAEGGPRDPEVLPPLEDGGEPRVDYAESDGNVKPFYLFADSQPLFWRPDGAPFLARVRGELDAEEPLAVYVGASNGDELSFYSLFEAAMDEAGIREHRMILSDPDADQLADLDRADLILLAGGEVERGWRVFEDNGLKQILVRRYYEGALMMGVSAGAVQLGLAGWSADGDRLLDTFRLLPFLIGAHEEAEGWRRLKQAVSRFGSHTPGYGIPFGAGMIYHPDRTVEPIRKPIYEMRMRGDGEVVQSVLMPGAEGDTPEAEPASGAATP